MPDSNTPDSVEIDRRQAPRESWLQAMKRELELQRWSDELTFDGIVSGKISKEEYLDREERKRKSSERDNLTGLENRAVFIDRFHMAFVESRKNKTPLSVSVADIDHFKDINDTLGHPSGDLVLRRLGIVALKLEPEVQGNIARVGGEEVMLILPGVPNSELAERVRIVGEGLISGWEQDPKLVDIIKNRVTVSMGACTLKDDESEEQFLERIDQALYAAKRDEKREDKNIEGRQRAKIEVAEGEYAEVSFRKN